MPGRHTATVRPSLSILSHALQTLLHEMIHAYCFLNKLRDADPTGHGAPFLAKMHFINSATFPDSQVWHEALLTSPSSGLNWSLTAWPCHASCALSSRGMPKQGQGQGLFPLESPDMCLSRCLTAGLC